MGQIIHFPNSKKDDSNIDVVQVSKDKIIINGVECKCMDLEEFIMGMDISPESEERFIKGLFEIIKEACFEDIRILKIFKEIFKGK
ncbi:hypothetical protein [Niameybacter massiliensis]|uniref:hypothetical protein n=1 Tax=Niameybacter massiliensis TaxID=1658108 RepID=UPI0006B59B2D|nr:hypothetical protein [Niameybacter massiliensis]